MNMTKKRTMIKDLSEMKGKDVIIKGWVDTARQQGKMAFFDFRDVSGKVQGVVFGKPEVLEVAKKLRSEWVVEIMGKVNERPENNKKEGVLNGDVELEITKIEVLAEAEIPFELNEEVNIDTSLDNRPFTLRSDKNRRVFKIQSEIIKSFREFLNSENFVEIQAPKLIGDDAEGGADVFEVEYFGSKASLATSPQLYKQIMVGIYERVFTTGNVYRAEKHSTTRHINEYTSIDYEFGFIKDHTTIMDMHENLLRYIVKNVEDHCKKGLEFFGVEKIKLPEGEIPRMKLTEAQELLEKEFEGVKAVGEPDLEPEHERLLCQYANEKLNSDFIFITHYPVSKRPFYTYEDENDKGYTKSFDMLFRGVEITTGGQRRNTYEDMVEGIKMKGLNPDDFSFYLQTFKTGMPPHGGIGMGLERLTQKFLGLKNVREATLFPRDMNRIDKLINE